MALEESESTTYFLLACIAVVCPDKVVEAGDRARDEGECLAEGGGVERLDVGRLNVGVHREVKEMMVLFDIIATCGKTQNAAQHVCRHSIRSPARDATVHRATAPSWHLTDLVYPLPNGYTSCPF